MRKEIGSLFKYIALGGLGLLALFYLGMTLSAILLAIFEFKHN
ncbi:hypothetical protein J25TS5_33590 [Paenibacillus faecis]|nr:hypothetical protein J25TS5_33590 [Paenibacillus faecis]